MRDERQPGITGPLMGTRREHVAWPRYRAASVRSAPLSTRARKERRRRFWRRVAVIASVAATAAALWIWAWPSIAGRP